MALIRHTVTNLRIRSTRGGVKDARTAGVIISYTEGADEHEWTLGLTYEKILHLLVTAKTELHDTDTPGISVEHNLDVTLQDGG